ncbi:dihydrodipicolinate synthase family protein [Fuerstiella marisgermanici]|uniref:L-2-keto-3-deoxyarabonate dehydratase n=1 Tax=Fuerstiella marisgermanici TaxID=1891926 RepID=A0A1P8WPG8_9PLAN|nr:dihydrodipicolinate synthase family protein [Fuerstiella marisgermanici]APZ95956.1 L-2-keto-3-deoxyarabonate dehydratase [Fuerstiella marisgermanici]
MSDRIEGVLPILHTPFDVHDRIDSDSLQREIEWALELGVNGVCSAMVSEILRLTTDERIALNRMIVEVTAGRATVIASVGAESTKQAVLFAQAAVNDGCDAIMAIPPISTALPQAALWKYFAALADAVDAPLIVQDASSYVGASIPTDFYVRLLDEYGPNKILFKPEGAPIGPNISDLRDASGGRAKMYDGSGGMLLVDAFRRGVAGTMPGVDLLDGIVALWNVLQRGDEAAAYKIYLPICAIVALQLQAGLDGFLAIEKYIMVKRGLFKSDRRREPNSWTLDSETQAEVDRLLIMLNETLA